MDYNSFEDTGLVKVLRFLKAHNKEYLSGQDLSDVLRISRVAVWKHIKKIRELGYKIESKRKTGYRLIANSERLLPWEITADLATTKIGKRVYYYDKVDSTQNVALLMANDMDHTNDGAVIISRQQTRGRGRSGKRWVSKDGGIFMSVMLYPKLDITSAMLFPVAASLALAKAIEQTLHITAQLRWPNDIMLQDKKVAGILVDVSLESNRVEHLVLGVGINFDVDIQDITAEIRDSKYGVASLNGKENRAVTLVQKFLVELEHIVMTLESKRIRNIIDEWTDRSYMIGKEVKIKTDNTDTIHGKIVRIDQDGALVVSSDKVEYRVIDSNDIQY